MDENLEKRMQESESDWADIEKRTAERIKKDKRIISDFCASNKRADMFQILELLEKHGGLPEHDDEIVKKFRESYPQQLTVKLIHDFLDVTDIYSQYLEFGGDESV